MPVHRFHEITWTEVRDADRRNAVAILPVGAVEAHGPHLPLGTDVIIAEGMARAAADVLSEGGRTVFVLPPVWYTAAPFARTFPGTVDVDGRTVTELVLRIASSLAEHQITTLAIANAHLDPTHLRALQEAVDDPPSGARIVHVDLTRRAVAARLTEEFRTGACHAGRYEGSVVRAEAPDLFRSEVADALPPVPNSLSDAIRDGLSTFGEAGGTEAYFGWPADATAEEGRETVRTLGALLAEAVEEGGA